MIRRITLRSTSKYFQDRSYQKIYRAEWRRFSASLKIDCSDSNERLEIIKADRKSSGRQANLLEFRRNTKFAHLKYWTYLGAMVSTISIGFGSISPAFGIGTFTFFMGNAMIRRAVMLRVLSNMDTQFTNSFFEKSFGAFPLHDTTLTELKDELALKAGLDPKTIKMYAIPTDQMNPFAIGLKENKFVLVTSGIVNVLNEQELRAILAHEIGHIWNGDSRLNTELGCMVSGFHVLSKYTWRYALYGRFFFNLFPNPLVRTFLWSAPVISAAGTLFQKWVSRDREYGADAFSVALTGGTSIATALMKMDNVKRSVAKNPSGLNLDANDAVFGHAFMMSAHSTTSSKNSSFLSIFDTHPSLTNRINAVNKDFEALPESLRQKRMPVMLFDNPRMSIDMIYGNSKDSLDNPQLKAFAVARFQKKKNQKKGILSKIFGKKDAKKEDSKKEESAEIKS